MTIYSIPEPGCSLCFSLQKLHSICAGSINAGSVILCISKSHSRAHPLPLLLSLSMFLSFLFPRFFDSFCLSFFLSLSNRLILYLTLGLISANEDLESLYIISEGVAHYLHSWVTIHCRLIVMTFLVLSINRHANNNDFQMELVW